MTEQPLEDQFRILTKFLDRFGSGAVGHAREELTDEQLELLRRLAAGDLDDSTRSAVVPLLAHNELAMEVLAKLAA